MSEATLLDQAHGAMDAAPEEERTRMGFYEKLAASELFMLLSGEVDGDQLRPETFEVEDETFVLVFDREERLAAFTGYEAPYAALSGRVIAEMLAAQGLGLGLNLDVAPSSALIPAAGVAWLASLTGEAPEQVEARAQAFFPPKGLPEHLLQALDARLASVGALAELAYLVAVTYDSGVKSHMLGFVDAVPGAEGALARLVAEALAFSGLDAAVLDVGFFRAEEPVSAQLAKAGLRFDLPKPDADLVRQPGAAPGRDPDKPPILR